MFWDSKHIKEGFHMNNKDLHPGSLMSEFKMKAICSFVGRFLKRNPRQFTVKGTMNDLFK